MRAAHARRCTPLIDYLFQQECTQLTLSASDLEQIIGTSLPTATWHRRFWRNDRAGGHTPPWRLAGWLVERVDFPAGDLVVTFGWAPLQALREAPSPPTTADIDPVESPTESSDSGS
jgi:hypothetical protein